MSKSIWVADEEALLRRNECGVVPRFPNCPFCPYAKKNFGCFTASRLDVY